MGGSRVRLLIWRLILGTSTFIPYLPFYSFLSVYAYLLYLRSSGKAFPCRKGRDEKGVHTATEAWLISYVQQLEKEGGTVACISFWTSLSLRWLSDCNRIKRIKVNFSLLLYPNHD